MSSYPCLSVLFVSVVLHCAILLLTADSVDSSDSEDTIANSGTSDLSLSNGWGSNYAWQSSLDTALSQASKQWKWVNKAGHLVVLNYLV